LIKTEISSFCRKPRTINPTQSNDGSEDNMGTMSVPSKTLCHTSEVANGDFFFDRKRLEPKTFTATALKESFCLLCDAHLWWQVSKTLLQYF